MIELLNKIHNSDNLKILAQLPDNSVDAIITDPPYELGFMGNKWDSSGIAYEVERWAEHLRVLKPGGHLLAFSGSRTYHRMATAIENAGFEMRDQISYFFNRFPEMKALFESFDSSQKESFLRIWGDSFPLLYWVYGSGFPKAKSHLKPAHEPICVARKPGKLRSLNIDDCRVEMRLGDTKGEFGARANNTPPKTKNNFGSFKENCDADNSIGRYPSNVILDEETAELLDLQSGVSGGDKRERKIQHQVPGTNTYGDFGGVANTPCYRDKGGASRFFYVAKAPPSERAGITHPTVKPIKLITQLIKLYTNENDVVFDGYGGSGTTAIVCHNENRNFILCESDEKNHAEASQRIEKHLSGKLIFSL